MSFLAVLGALNALSNKSNESPTASSSQDGTVPGHSARSNIVWPNAPSNPYA